MPAPVRSACARRLAGPRQTPFPIPAARRHFRVWWSSPWDTDHARRHRALWQRYAKLRGDVWGPQWGPPHSFPPLMREMQKFDKWVRDLDNRLDSRGVFRRPSGPLEAWEPRGYAQRRGEPRVPFVRGREEREKGVSDGEKPVERPKKNDPKPQEGGVWTASSLRQKGVFIDPVTNKRVPRSEQTGSSDDSGRKGASIESSPSTTTIHLGPGSAEVGSVAKQESLAEDQTSSIERFERAQAGRPGRKCNAYPSTKNRKGNAKTVDLKPKSPTPAPTEIDIGEDGLPAKSNESPADTRVQDRRKMTGNFVKDFPEEFAEAWTGRYRSETSVEKASTERLEPALNRTGAASVGCTSKETKPVEQTTHETKPVERKTTHEELVEEIKGILTDTAERKTTHEELVEEIKGILTDTAALGGMPAHSAAPERPNSDPESSKESTTSGYPPDDTDEHALYKIVTYDPQTQTVTATDASPVAPDHTDEPLTTAQAISRLANPAEFVPHLATLEAQGYEVVSGGASTLVFKRRAPTEPGTVFLRGTRRAALPAKGDGDARAVNPIDMMGREPVVPSIGNFASPTGYVDYGEGRAEEAVGKRKPPPPFRDESEVEYTEGEGEGEGRKRGVLWRASVGAAWVAGLVYGGSVVGEFFSTGGESGEGSRGEF